MTSNNGKEEPLTPPHTPSEESERLRTLGGVVSGHKTSSGVGGAAEETMESYLTRYTQYTQAQAGHTMQEVRGERLLANIFQSALLLVTF